MYTWGNINSHHSSMGHGHRNFSMYTKPVGDFHKVEPPTQSQPHWQNITEKFLNIPHCKKFTNPNFVNNMQGQPQSHGILYEKCSVFINNSNGYPNNPPKTHFEQASPVKTAPMDILIKESTKSKSPNKKKYNKKHKTRKNWHKQTLSMDNLIEDVDEIGTDVCNDPTYLNPNNCDTSVSLGVVESSPWKPPTLGEFIRKSSPRKIGEEIILKLPNSPICIKISTPVYFSISPPKSIGHRRTPSDCVSEDSFVIFDDRDSESSCSEEEDDEDDDSDSDCSGDESDFIDFNDNSCKNTPKTDVEDIPLTTKKVRFAEGKDLVEIHPMIAWSYAYQASRKGHWEEYARDRCRFKDRVESCGKEIEKVFDPAHRGKVFKERFEQFISEKDCNPKITNLKRNK